MASNPPNKQPNNPPNNPHQNRPRFKTPTPTFHQNPHTSIYHLPISLTNPSHLPAPQNSRIYQLCTRINTPYIPTPPLNLDYAFADIFDAKWRAKRVWHEAYRRSYPFLPEPMDAEEEAGVRNAGIWDVTGQGRGIGGIGNGWQGNLDGNGRGNGRGNVDGDGWTVFEMADGVNRVKCWEKRWSYEGLGVEVWVYEKVVH